MYSDYHVHTSFSFDSEETLDNIIKKAVSLNMKQIPCIIEDYDDKQTQTLAIIENIQREDLSPLEEAKAYQALIKEYGYSQTELADIVGKKQSTIANKLRLLKLSDDVQFSLPGKPRGGCAED